MYDVPAIREHPPPENVYEDRRASDGSDSTLYSEPEERQEDFSNFNFSSYKHPYDIKPPPAAHGAVQQDTEYYSRASEVTNSPALKNTPQERDIEKAMEVTSAQIPRRRRGYLTNLIDLYNAYDDSDDDPASQRRNTISDSRRISGLVDSLAYDEEQILEPDDPLVTGIHKNHLEDEEDIEKNARRLMSYKERRKQLEKIRIEFNVSCMSLSPDMCLSKLTDGIR